METILKIEDLEGDEDGFAVVTTEQRIELGIGNDSNCCERWGHFWCNDKPEEFIGANVTGVTLTDTALVTEKAPDLYEGGVMFMNIETDRGVLQFVAYNAHNGYYGHTARVTCKQLEHEERL